VTIHNRKLKTLTFTVGTAPDEEQFQCQVKTWNIENNTEDGEKLYSYCGPGSEGEAREEADPDYALTWEGYSDWRDNGISDWAWRHDGEEVAFRVDHHPDIAAEHKAWSGTVKVKAPTVGGEARTTEMSSFAWPIIGKPDYHPNGGESTT
jgi:hypothetical protein